MSVDTMNERLARLKREQRLYSKPVSEWSDDDLFWVLAARYAPTEIPPCRICGAALSLQSVGGGDPTVWACDGRDESGKMKEGRRAVDEHYSASRFVDRRMGGDEAVMDLVRRYRERAVTDPTE